jgi:hypothetical protein
MQEIPTPPHPNTTTEEPGVTLAVLMAAPTPVITPQPMRLAISNGTSSSIFTTPWYGRIISSANVPAPAIPKTASPPIRKWGVPPITIWMFEHRLGCLRSTQNRQDPHGGLQATITWSPSATLVTPSPTAVMTPAPSWPSTAGGGCGIVPFMHDRSEWHTPVASILTRTSPGPTSTSSMSSRISSSASPMLRSSAARIVSPWSFAGGPAVVV